MTRTVRARVDRLDSAALFSVPDLTGELADELFASPASAVAALTEELHSVWAARSAEIEDRPIGSLGLESGAYVQWIGYSRRLVVEVSSNAYLERAARLTADEEQQLERYGFRRPDRRSPNFALETDDSRDVGRVAVAVVSVLTAVFGVYVG